MKLPFSAPQTRAAVDGGGTLTGVEFRLYAFNTDDPTNITASANWWIIEDGPVPGRPVRTVTVTGIALTDQVQSIVGKFKAAIQAQLNGATLA